MSEQTALTIAKLAKRSGMGSAGILSLLRDAGCKWRLSFSVVRAVLNAR